ncbi:MAG: ABC transporter ATP-binding protein [Spirulina sp. SIO3F2]|nr:ABC transporter ATP-binding protein [Spirulina sp. SIO3F2]
MTSDQPESILQVWELQKTYRTGFWLNKTVPSLKGVTLSVEPGETFGLLGPNGAGKTTLLKIVLGIVRRSGGRAKLLGMPIGDRATRAQIGYLPENAYYYDYLTAWEFLSFMGGLFELPGGILKERIPQLLDWVGLDLATAKTKPLKQYSKGMLQRVGMAQALINNPDVIFLDEPMSGLDPTGRYRMREIILALKAQGKTIFFNSHILADVEQICDRVAILHQGELLTSGSLAELLPKTEQYQVQGYGMLPEAAKSLMTNLEEMGDRWSGQLQGDRQAFLNQLHNSSATLEQLTLHHQSLEEFFLAQIQDQDSGS